MDTFSDFTLELYTSSTNHTAKPSDIKAAVRRFFYEWLVLVVIHLKHRQANPQLHSFLEEQMPLLGSWEDYDGDLDLTANPCLVSAASTLMHHLPLFITVLFNYSIYFSPPLLAIVVNIPLLFFGCFFFFFFLSIAPFVFSAKIVLTLW